MSRCRYSIEYSIDPWVSIISCAKDRWTPWPMLLSTLLTPHTTLCLLLISLHCSVVRCTVHSAHGTVVHCTRTAALLHISPHGTVLHIGHILRATCYIYICICLGWAFAISEAISLYKVKYQKTEKRPQNSCVLKYFKYKTFSIFDIAFEACNGVKVAHNIAQSTSHFTASEVFLWKVE